MLTSNVPYVLRAYFEWILDNNCTPYLLVDASGDAVCVPQEHVKNDQIVLNISPVASSGLIIENDGISFKARFSGVSRGIYVPIACVLAIYARESGRGMAFSKGNCIEMNPAPLQTSAVENSLEAQEKSSAPAPDATDESTNVPPKRAKGKPSLTIVK